MGTVGVYTPGIHPMSVWQSMTCILLEVRVLRFLTLMSSSYPSVARGKAAAWAVRQTALRAVQPPPLRATPLSAWRGCKWPRSCAARRGGYSAPHSCVLAIVARQNGAGALSADRGEVVDLLGSRRGEGGGAQALGLWRCTGADGVREGVESAGVLEAGERDWVCAGRACRDVDMARCRGLKHP